VRSAGGARIVVARNGAPVQVIAPLRMAARQAGGAVAP